MISIVKYAAVVLLTAAAPLLADEYARGPAPRGGLLFHASFDNGPRADAGAGFLAMHYSSTYNADHRWEFAFVDGRLGKALDLHPGRKGGAEMACFKSQGHVCAPVGTMSFWFKSGGPAPEVRLETQSNDYWLMKRLFHLSGKAPAALNLTTAARDYQDLPLALEAAGWGDGKWHHLAVVWDEAFGMRAYLDGREIASSWGKQPFQRGYLSAGRLALSNAVFDDFRLYDIALAPAAVQSLAAGQAPRIAAAPAPFLIEHRLEALSWKDAPDAHFIPAAGPTRIRRIGLEDARALRKSGWRAVDGRDDSGWPLFYHNYTYLKSGNLHLTAAKGEQFNFIRATGYLKHAALCEGGAWERPEGAALLHEFTGERFVQARPLAAVCAAPAVSVYRDADFAWWSPAATNDPNSPQRRHMIHDLALLNVSEGASADPETLNFFIGGQQPETVAGPNRVRLITWYRPEERAVALAAPEPAESELAVPALRYTHLMTVPRSEDTAVSAVRLRLEAGDWKRGNLVNVRVHDPFNLWRALIDVDLRLERDGVLDVTLEFPPTILPADTELWVTLVSRDAGRLRCGRNGSRLALHGPAMEVARAAYLAWQHRLLKDNFAIISEPRPWGHNKMDDAPLRVAFGSYDAIARIKWDLYERFPDDRWTLGYMIYTHPKTKFFSELPMPELPRDPGAPDWALLQKELFKQYLGFAHWWVDVQGVPNGELGSGIQDDTDLVGDWTSLIMRYDPDGKLRANLLALSDTAWTNLIRNGLNIYSHTPRHSYEEGLNVTPLAALLEYGDPVLWERLLATARRYGEIYPLRDGKRLYIGLKNLSDENVRKAVPADSAYGVNGDSSRLWHPGAMLVWYNGSRTLTQMLAEVLAGAQPSWQPQYMDLYHLLWQQTGDARYQRSFWEETLKWQDPTWTRLLNRTLPEGTPVEKVVHKWGLGSIAGTDSSGFGDYQPLLYNYLYWHYTRDKSYLAQPMQNYWKQNYYVMPLWTATGQSGDRVAVHKNYVDFMLFGGIPSAREHIVPNFAVSYEGFNAEVGALVIDDTAELLRWTGFNFEQAPQAGRLRVWRLAPGLYDVSMGADDNGDDRIDGQADVRRMALKRYETIPVTLPARRAFIVEARLVEKDVPLHDRCDLAITPRDAVREGGRLTVTAHNIGRKPTGPFEVVLKDAAGREAARQKHAGLEGIENLQDQKAGFTFEQASAGAARVELVGTRPEITEVNNAALIP